MRKTTAVLALAIGAATIGISVAPLAGADTSNCQQIGSSTICGQGNVSGGGPAPGGGSAGPANNGGSGCQNAYGQYQNCNVH